jgi:hypothetical protein
MLPLLKCISKSEANYVLHEIHERICDSHVRSRMLAHKAIKSSYFWTHMNEYLANIVQNCDKCERFTRVTLATRNQDDEKLGLKWEGLYQVIRSERK